MIALLRRKRCFSITCTNGLALDSFTDIARSNPYCTFLVSLDGLEPENDRIRGRGVYKRVTANIQKLKAMKRSPYIGIEFTIQPANVATMYEFCCAMVDYSVDWIILNPCWFLSAQQALDYERFMQSHFNITPKTHHGYVRPYNLDKSVFLEQMSRINEEKWPIQVSSLLKNPEDIHTYIDQPDVPPGNYFCYRQWTRMDITPEGQVSPCILYPDLTVGDLRQSGVLQIWNSPEFTRFRQVRRDAILPICAKCNGLYLHDSKRKSL